MKIIPQKNLCVKMNDTDIYNRYCENVQYVTQISLNNGVFMLKKRTQAPCTDDLKHYTIVSNEHFNKQLRRVNSFIYKLAKSNYQIENNL